LFEITLVIIIVALLFDFLNGMNDAANSISTIVATRVLSPKLAVLWAAFFNFIAAFFFGVHVATTVGKGIVQTAVVTEPLIFAGLLGAIIWTHLCTRLGLPISVSHALIGGLAGAAVTKAGLGSLISSGLIKVAVFIVLSPVIGFVLGVILMITVTWIFRRFTVQKVDRVFRIGQLVSSAAFSLGHGTNDAQKTMGIIAILLFTAGYLGDTFYVPFWVIISAHISIGLGTLVGGWRVIKTMGMKLTQLRPVGGFCAETAGAVVLLGTAFAGIPVSTTHTIAGSIMGVGSIKRVTAVKWGVAGRIIWAWILTIPMSGLTAGIFYWLISYVLRAG
jgi:PiT family inorganic phosphate transporter